MLPLFILTGFLGSGKTTVLNQLLSMRAASGTPGRIGLIVNELGDIGVDGALLPPGASRQIELPGGCVCCVLSEDLANTIVELLEQSPELEAIVLETTGAAEPLPLVWALENPPLAERVRLAAIVTVVDAEGFVPTRHLTPAVEAQVLHADIVLLSKEDLAAPEAVEATLAAVRELAPRVEIRRGGPTAHARWLHTMLLDPGAELREHGDERHECHDEHCPGPSDPHHPHGHHHDRARPEASPEHVLESAGAHLPDRVVDLEELEDHLAELPASYVRIKGITRGLDGRRGNDDVGWYAFHRVGLRMSSEPLSHAAEPRVVALGRGIDIGAVLACIERSVVDS